MQSLISSLRNALLDCYLEPSSLRVRNLTEKNVKAQGTIFVPGDAGQVRAVIALIGSWPGPERGVYEPSGRKLGDAEAARRVRSPAPTTPEDLAIGRFRDQAWRDLSHRCECALLHLRLGTIRPELSDGVAVNGVVVRNGISNRVIRTAGEGGAEALLAILQQLGEGTAHKELKDAPLLFWGWSAAASLGTTFAELHPERTIAFIRYHSHLHGLQVDTKTLSTIPALLVAGGRGTKKPGPKTPRHSGRAHGHYGALDVRRRARWHPCE